MAVCGVCGDARRLRWDRAVGGWRCVERCRNTSSGFRESVRARSRKAKRGGLFCGHWTDPATGERWRATRAELAEAYRLWAIGKDIREGRAA